MTIWGGHGYYLLRWQHQLLFHHLLTVWIHFEQSPVAFWRGICLVVKLLIYLTYYLMLDLSCPLITRLVFSNAAQTLYLNLTVSLSWKLHQLLLFMKTVNLCLLHHIEQILQLVKLRISLHHLQIFALLDCPFLV